MNIIDIVILVVLAVSVVYGLYRGFISGVLSLAALIGSAALAFAFSGELAAWLNGNQTLVDTLMYYTDAGSRISNLELSMLTVSQVKESASVLAQILESARLPEAFQNVFMENIASGSGTASVSTLLSQTIVSVSLSILSFLICFLIAYIVLTFVIHLIQYVFELPVLRHLDALIGGVFGLARGVMLLFILFTVVPIVMAVVPIEPLQAMIDASRLAPLFDSRLIMTILNGGV